MFENHHFLVQSVVLYSLGTPVVSYETTTCSRFLGSSSVITPLKTTPGVANCWFRTRSRSDSVRVVCLLYAAPLFRVSNGPVAQTLWTTIPILSFGYKLYYFFIFFLRDVALHFFGIFQMQTSVCQKIHIVDISDYSIVNCIKFYIYYSDFTDICSFLCIGLIWSYISYSNRFIIRRLNKYNFNLLFVQNISFLNGILEDFYF